MNSSQSTSRFVQAARRDRGRRSVRQGFSLVEMMIAIVILGLGLILVATVFPVAWSRARTLSEHTIERSVSQNAAATVESLIQVVGPQLNAADLSGDFVFEPTNSLIVQYSDTRVRALHLENMLMPSVTRERQFVPEDPWEIERSPNVETAPEFADLPEEFKENCYVQPQVRFHQRMYPPMRAREHVADDGTFSQPDEQWDEVLDARGYCWSALHRLREQIGPPPGVALDPEDELALAEQGSRAPRPLDWYIVTLRRTQPTHRYAVQDPETTPDPYNLDLQVADPRARDATHDVMLPVAWRVQIRIMGEPATKGNEYSTPTEVMVPAHEQLPNETTSALLIPMFRVGTYFVDELNGQVYRVAQQRVSPDGRRAVLTLDREILVEDLDIPELYPPCGGACFDGTLQNEEMLRTVWVYPPPIEARTMGLQAPVYAGPSPVIGIDIVSTTVTPES
jgi:prepilin-type N-terminal cleavage/methylation domain-containing protein